MYSYVLYVYTSYADPDKVRSSVKILKHPRNWFRNYSIRFTVSENIAILTFHRAC